MTKYHIELASRVGPEAATNKLMTIHTDWAPNESRLGKARWLVKTGKPTFTWGDKILAMKRITFSFTSTVCFFIIRNAMTKPSISFFEIIL